jgi:hypothetical protein
MIYVLEYNSKGPGVVINPPLEAPAVWDAWAESVKRGEARKTLEPDLYPDAGQAAIDDLMARFPEWQIIKGQTRTLNTAKLIWRPK